MPSIANLFNYRDAMHAASKRRKYILSLSRSGKTNTQIAKLIGVSKQRVGQILAEARRES